MKILFNSNYFISSKNGKELTNKEIEDIINEVTNYLINEDEKVKRISLGNLTVVGIKYDDYIDIIVSDDYYEGKVVLNDGACEVVDWTIEEEEPILYNPRKEV